MAARKTELQKLDEHVRLIEAGRDVLERAQLVQLHRRALEVVGRHLDEQWSPRRRGTMPSDFLLTMMLETACVYSAGRTRRYPGQAHRSPAFGRVMQRIEDKLEDRARGLLDAIEKFSDWHATAHELQNVEPRECPFLKLMRPLLLDLDNDRVPYLVNDEEAEALEKRYGTFVFVDVIKPCNLAGDSVPAMVRPLVKELVGVRRRQADTLILRQALSCMPLNKGEVVVVLRAAGLSPSLIAFLMSAHHSGAGAITSKSLARSVGALRQAASEIRKKDATKAAGHLFDLSATFDVFESVKSERRGAP
jgi:hypothetical protein